MRVQGKYVVMSALILALLVSPFAIAAGEGDPLEGGVRNPSNNQERELTRETEIIAETNTYGTRQSNKSNNGGGAIYGCRSGAGGTPAGNEPCVRANNLAAGLAFEFESGGNLGGTITVDEGGDERKPFTTNATGVATGLNADRVDGLEGDQLRARYAQVRADGGAGATRGVQDNGVSRQGEGDYDVVFAGDISTCALSTALTNSTDPGTVTTNINVAADRSTSTVDVRTFGADADDDGVEDPDDRAFHLAAHC